MLHLYLVTDGRGSWPLLHEGPLPESPPSEGRPHVALLGRFADRETALSALELARSAIGASSTDPEERARGTDFALAALIPDKDRRRRKRARTLPFVRPPRE